MAASAEMLLDEEIPNIDEDLLLELGKYKQKENVGDVKLGTELDDSQSQQLQALVVDYASVFSDVPRRTSKIEHRINLMDEEPVRLKPYPLRYALRQELKDKIREMLDMGAIRKLSSPYASPILFILFIIYFISIFILLTRRKATIFILLTRSKLYRRRMVQTVSASTTES